MDDQAERIRAAGAALEALRAPLGAGEPWPLSEVWGTEDEAQWGPPEVLAHTAEMLAYWHAELARVAAADGSAAVPFGRIASDPGRLARIDRLRRQSTTELLDEIRRQIPEVAAFVAGLTVQEAARRGLHQTRGEMTVADGVERFFANHLDEHVEQLRTILARAPG